MHDVNEHGSSSASSAGSPVSLTSGLGETVLPDPPAEALAALQLAGSDRNRLAEVAASNPTYLTAWAHLGDAGRDQIESYAYYRVGYHRGLDALRAAGWRGSGYVYWKHPTNQGFLRCLAGLAEVAARIGENAEAQRCEGFLRQLAPDFGS